jgi:hypothetical protein
VVDTQQKGDHAILAVKIDGRRPQKIQHPRQSTPVVSVLFNHA